MRLISLAILTLFSSGCTLQTTVPANIQETVSAQKAIPVSQTNVVEIRYEISEYADASNPSILHEAHAIYRKTRVATNTENQKGSISHSTTARTTVAPLPESVELAAELAKQKAITEELVALKASLAEIEKKMRAQYGKLVRQSADVLELQKKFREKKRDTTEGQSPTSAPPSPVATASDTPTVKW